MLKIALGGGRVLRACQGARDDGASGQCAASEGGTRVVKERKGVDSSQGVSKAFDSQVLMPADTSLGPAHVGHDNAHCASLPAWHVCAHTHGHMEVC